MARPLAKQDWVTDAASADAEQAGTSRMGAWTGGCSPKRMKRRPDSLEPESLRPLVAQSGGEALVCLGLESGRSRRRNFLSHPHRGSQRSCERPKYQAEDRPDRASPAVAGVSRRTANFSAIVSNCGRWR